LRTECGDEASFDALRQVARQFQSLCFAAGQGRHRLAEAQVLKTDIRERAQSAQYIRIGAGSSRRPPTR